MNLPKDSAARKGTPVTTGVLDYFPLAIAAVSRLSKAGNDKHNPGEPLHWSREKSTDHADCIGRHLIERGSIEPESGESHDACLAWRAMANLQLAEEKRLAVDAGAANTANTTVVSKAEPVSFMWGDPGVMGADVTNGCAMPPPQVNTAPEPQWLKDRLDDHAHVGGMHPDGIRKEYLASKAERGAGWTPIKALGRDAMARDNGDGTRTVRYCEPVLAYSYQADGDGMCTTRRREDSPSHTYHVPERPPVLEPGWLIEGNQTTDLYTGKVTTNHQSKGAQLREVVLADPHRNGPFGMSILECSGARVGSDGQMWMPVPEGAKSKPFTFWYLATPYTRFPAGHEAAFNLAARLAAHLMRKGIPVFSPIAHSHPIAQWMPTASVTDHGLWMRMDGPLMDAASGMIVVTAESWETSKGMAEEIRRFTAAGKPVVYWDPSSSVPTRILDTAR